jgi:hypothetical protein
LIRLFGCSGGEIVLPDRKLVLVDRADGGNLVVNPPREVWERGQLSAHELTRWSFLVAAVGRAMIDSLPQLAGGCVNYWEAGNWVLNDDAEPRGKKTAPQHRKVHLHLLGRSTNAVSPSWRWGEGPKWPDFADRFGWASEHQRLTPGECVAVVDQTARLLTSRYGMDAKEIRTSETCIKCRYPVTDTCAECAR